MRGELKIGVKWLLFSFCLFVPGMDPFDRYILAVLKDVKPGGSKDSWEVGFFPVHYFHDLLTLL